jgi:tetratricopeptide (TPR) repeat protein
LIFLFAAALVAAPVSSDPCPGTTPDALVCRALKAQKEGDPDGAAEAFEEAAKASNDKDPKTVRMWAAAGNLWIEANQPGKAAIDLDRALAMPGLEGDQRGEALLDRARAAESQNDLMTARARATDAAGIIPDDPFVWYFSAALAIREGDVATAQTSIARALKLAPNDPAVLFEAGHVAHFAGDDDKARNDWERSSNLDKVGPVGKAARDALAMLPATPTLVTQPPAKPK